MSLAEYNSLVITMYNSGASVQGILSKIGNPAVTEEYVLNTIKMVYGERGMREISSRVSSEPSTPSSPNAANPSKEAKVQKGKKVVDNGEKLFKVLMKRSDENLKKLGEIIKSPDETYQKKDKARFTLGLIYDDRYRELWMSAHDVSEQSIIDKATELGKEKFIRPITKKELSAFARICNVFVKVRDNEEKVRGKKVIPLYMREVSSKNRKSAD